jgi:hypothetical protein
MSLSPGFGLKLAEIFSTPDTTILYMPLQSSYISGSNDVFIKKYGVAIDFYSVQSFLTGQFFTYPYFKKMEDYTYFPDKYKISLTLKNPRNQHVTDVSHKVFFTKNFNVDSVSILDFVLNQEIYYKNQNFSNFNKIYLPNSISLQVVTNDTITLNIKIKNVKINTEPKIKFKLPENAKKISN